MNKKWIAAVLICCMMLTGCQLAREDAPADNGVNMADQLVGVVVTTEYLDLFDMEAYLEDHLDEIMDGEEVVDPGKQYSGRIYAKEIVEESQTEDGVSCTTTYYSFEDMDSLGALLNYNAKTYLADGTLHADFMTGSCDGGVSAVEYRSDRTDSGTVLDCAGTIHMPKGTGVVQIFVNPVYQDAQGRLYLVSGNSISTNDLGAAMSMYVTDEHTVTENGVEATHSGKFTITVESVELPDSVVVVMMDSDHQILDRQAYVPGRLPDELIPVEGTAYLLVEEYFGEEVNRTLLQEGDDHFDVFYLGEEIYCMVDYVNVNWEE